MKEVRDYDGEKGDLDNVVPDACAPKINMKVGVGSLHAHQTILLNLGPAESNERKGGTLRTIKLLIDWRTHIPHIDIQSW